jgi:hypothetical protein
MKLNVTLTRSAAQIRHDSDAVQYTWSACVSGAGDTWDATGDGDSPGEAFTAALTTLLFTRIEGDT